MSEPLALHVEPSSPVRMFAAGRFDVERVRADFPILRRHVRGCALTYLDNAATTQKPQVVLDAQRQRLAHFPSTSARSRASRA